MKQQLGLVVSSMETLRRTVVNLNLDKSPVPLMFVIELQPTEDEQVLAAIEARDAKALAKHATSLFGRVKNVFNAKGTTEKIQAAVDELIGGSQRTMTLRLICQYTMEPVGAGYRIHAPREFVPKVLPALCAHSPPSLHTSTLSRFKSSALDPRALAAAQGVRPQSDQSCKGGVRTAAELRPPHPRGAAGAP